MKKAFLFMILGLMALASVFSETQSDEEWKREMERKIEILTREIEKGKMGPGVTPAEKSHHGFGPAASKVYNINRGVSIGGYGEMVYQNFNSKKDDGTPSNKNDQLDFLRQIIYVGYKFSDRILFNTEIEFEHATTANGGSRGEVSVEFAYLDFMIQPWGNVRTGLLLVPVGITNELHEPTLFHGSNRPSVEKNIIPTTWRENGVGFFGSAGPFRYKTYLMAGLQAIKDNGNFGGFGASSGIRGGRTKGSKSSAEDMAWVGRVDYEGVAGTLLGGSLYTGKSGQNFLNANGDEIDAPVTLWEIHGTSEYKGLELKGLYTQGRIGDVTDLNAAQPTPFTGNQSIGERQFGGYLEVAFDVLSLSKCTHSLSPFFRYERYDTQQKVPEGFSKDPANSRIEYTYGLTYKPHPNVVVKVDYQDIDNQAGTGIDQFNAAVGFMF